MSQKGDFGAVKPDPLGSMELGESDIAQQADIGIQRHPVPVLALRREIPDPVQFPVKGAVFSLQALVFARDLMAGVDVDDPRIPVDNE